MQISEALQALKNGDSIIVRDKTFEPHSIDEFQLETGETVFWVKDGENMWLSIDEGSEEVILFNEIEADIDPAAETIFYGGDDYEFSLEVSAKVLDEDGEEIDQIDFKDFDRGDGQLLRAMEYEVSGDVMVVIGSKISDEELYEA